MERAEADRTAEIVRRFRLRGVTFALPDVLIGATALERGVPLCTGNARHYPMEDLDVREIAVRGK